MAALRQTIHKQNEDIRVYKQNEMVLKSQLATKPSLRAKENLGSLPYYEPANKPEPLSFSVITSAVSQKTDNKIIPSPVKVNYSTVSCGRNS